ncbi:hypothetical protein [Pseudomonas sp. PA15(2017)]|uniref:hypothetical protein n=1 Tax=Pseudomonas sp. PA15(2017) TaxID=1932111 RepID=UPI00143C0D02|nr:hypothetical protein [Pseudomonas sp. PA15(2017)]
MQGLFSALGANEVTTGMFVKKALFIDDAFARPTVSQFQPHLNALRGFLSDNEETKQWLDGEFGLSGSHTARSYFAPLVNDAGAILRFWQLRNSSPSGAALESVFTDLVEELSPHHSPLEAIDGILKGHGWEVRRSAVLPDVASVETDVALIVIDYQLSQDDHDLEARVQESIDFLKSVVEKAKNTPNAIHPFIILISSLPHLANRHAGDFRIGSSTPGGMFRFVRKLNVGQEFVGALESYYVKREELQKFRCLHIELERAVSVAGEQLSKHVTALELEDLATLYTAQLVTEKEPLSDYVGWLAGQLVMSSIQKSPTLAQKAMDLPDESYEILLGHCQPTQNLSNVFSEFSSVRPASGELIKSTRKNRDIRFGDIFVKKPRGKAGQLTLEEQPYYLVISQTCDLLQGKITNGQVLCVQGCGREVKSTEIDLLQATIRQMGVGGDFLIKNQDKYFQIAWAEKDLLTVDQKKLSKESGYDYVGRLNEIYALEVQHSALHSLGRIGVPVVPGYRVFFGMAEIRVYGNRGEEIAELRRSLNNSSVLCVLRNEKVGSVKLRLLFSGELRRWLHAELQALVGLASFPAGATKGAGDFITALSAGESYSLTGKAKGDEIEGFAIASSVNLIMKNLPQVAKNNPQPRVQLELSPSIHFAGDISG